MTSSVCNCLKFYFDTINYSVADQEETRSFLVVPERRNLEQWARRFTKTFYLTTLLRIVSKRNFKSGECVLVIYKVLYGFVNIIFTNKLYLKADKTCCNKTIY